jgi:Rab GTPase-activating protein 1
LSEAAEFLSYTENRPDLTDKYRILITKETKSEQIILRDIGRTFPAHDFFRDDGSGQESLYKVSRAYSVYDQEVSGDFFIKLIFESAIQR